MPYPSRPSTRRRWAAARTFLGRPIGRAAVLVLILAAEMGLLWATAFVVARVTGISVIWAAVATVVLVVVLGVVTVISGTSILQPRTATAVRNIATWSWFAIAGWIAHAPGASLDRFVFLISAGAAGAALATFWAAINRANELSATLEEIPQLVHDYAQHAVQHPTVLPGISRQLETSHLERILQFALTSAHAQNRLGRGTNSAPPVPRPRFPTPRPRHHQNRGQTA